MNKALRILIVVLAAGLLGAILWLERMANRPSHEVLPATAPARLPPVRLGVVPEHDIFALRKSYNQLADYLSPRLGRPVQIVMLNSYEAVLDDYDDSQIEGAFLGSLVAVLAMDRCGAQAIVKPERADGLSTYRGILFVREDSPITSFEQAAGKRIAVVRTTTAGCLFAMCEIVRTGLLEGGRTPQLIPVGTHDEVVRMVLDGKADVGSVKDLRLDAYLREHPEERVRRLRASAAVPNNALVMRKDVAATVGPELARALKAMANDPGGREALAALGATRFVDAAAEEYGPVHDMIEAVGSHWEQVGLPCGPPRRPGQ